MRVPHGNRTGPARVRSAAVRPVGGSAENRHQCPPVDAGEVYLRLTLFTGPGRSPARSTRLRKASASHLPFCSASRPPPKRRVSSRTLTGPRTAFRRQWPHFARFDDAHPGRHNGIVWPLVNGMFACAAAEAGRTDIFESEAENAASLVGGKRQPVLRDLQPANRRSRRRLAVVDGTGTRSRTRLGLRPPTCGCCTRACSA